MSQYSLVLADNTLAMFCLGSAIKHGRHGQNFNFVKILAKLANWLHKVISDRSTHRVNSGLTIITKLPDLDELRRGALFQSLRLELESKSAAELSSFLEALGSENLLIPISNQSFQ